MSQKVKSYRGFNLFLECFQDGPRDSFVEIYKNGELIDVTICHIDPDDIVFEGTKTKCLEYVRKHFGMRKYKNGYVRVAKLIWEDSPKEYIDKVENK